MIDPDGAPGREWHQVLLQYPDYTAAERTAAEHLEPAMTALESDGVISSWFFMRKRPCWRLRMRLADTAVDNTGETPTRVDEHLDRLVAATALDRWTHTIYEPEVHAFGGPTAMKVAHDLFYRDSRHILTSLTPDPDRARPPTRRTSHSGCGRFLRSLIRPGAGHRKQLAAVDVRHPHNGDARPDVARLQNHRREVSMLLCRNLMCGAGLDWFEQGDVWARVADLRTVSQPHATTRSVRHTTQSFVRPSVRDDVRRLLTVDADPTGPLLGPSGALEAFGLWAQAFNQCGEHLRELADTGTLTRGIRSVIAHHVIFHWNRMGLDHIDQSVLSHAARTVVFDPRDEAI